MAVRFSRSPAGVIALAALLAIVSLATFANLIAPQNPYDLNAIDILDSRLPPLSQSMSDTTYWLGTDGQGRDMLSAMLYGLRTSLIVGFSSAFIAAGVGTTMGLTAAYARGWLEIVIMRLVDLQLSFPSILVALMILAFLGKGITNVVLALVIVEWATYARTARATALTERGKEYIEAAECLGVPTSRIIFGHLLPNCIPPLIVIGTIQIARAITLEATLSFLGLGVPITQPSLGLLISNGFEFLLSGDYWISLSPGILLLVVVVAINLVGDELREAANPRQEA
jgi:peptide/nickel transport system permease protein